jgi:purine-binding chemotaxis protein CheW
MTQNFETITGPVTGVNTPGQNSEQNQNAIQYLLISVDNWQYGVQLTQLQEVMRYNPELITPVPNTVDWLEGVTSLRGTITSVVDLRTFVGLKREEAKLGSVPENILGRTIQRLLVVYSQEMIIGLVVDDIKGMLFALPEDVSPLSTTQAGSYGPLGQYLGSIYRNPENGEIIPILEAARLVNSPTLREFKNQVLQGGATREV